MQALTTVQTIFESQILKWMKIETKRPVIIGINGPQGSGKTTLTKSLIETLPFKVVAISLDDFYIPFAEQKTMQNPLLKYRGLPGTHSVDLAIRTLESLIAKQLTLVPRFDKSLHNGLGDRLPESQWAKVDGDVDVILLEGWCLGFKYSQNIKLDPLEFEFKFSDLDLQEVNQNLVAYEQLYKLIDCFCYIKADDIKNVLEWRWQQEETMKSKLGPDAGLSKSQVRDFVSRFMPMYKIYSQSIEHGIFVPPRNFLKVEIDILRKVKSVTDI